VPTARWHPVGDRAGLAGGLLAAVVAFTPSFLFVLLGAPRFDRIRQDTRPSAFPAGAGPVAIGAIIGVAVPLALALGETWQHGLLATGAIALLPLRRPVVVTLICAGFVGAIAAQIGAPFP
jgi:chromate transporter